MRSLPPPWTIEEHNNACFIVKDANGQALAYAYFEGEPGRRSAAKLLTRDEARRMGGRHRQAAGGAQKMKFRNCRKEISSALRISTISGQNCCYCSRRFPESSNELRLEETAK